MWGRCRVLYRGGSVDGHQRLDLWEAVNGVVSSSALSIAACCSTNVGPSAGFAVVALSTAVSVRLWDRGRHPCGRRPWAGRLRPSSRQRVVSSSPLSTVESCWTLCNSVNDVSAADRLTSTIQLLWSRHLHWRRCAAAIFPSAHFEHVYCFRHSR